MGGPTKCGYKKKGRARTLPFRRKKQYYFFAARALHVFAFDLDDGAGCLALAGLGGCLRRGLLLVRGLRERGNGYHSEGGGQKQR